jgi:soluble lytic murein transglycosylase-like protein
MYFAKLSSLLTRFRQLSLVRQVVAGGLVASLSSALFLGSLIAVDEQVIEDAARFDPQSPLALPEALPSNSHPYPEALAGLEALRDMWELDRIGEAAARSLLNASPNRLVPGAVVGGLMLSAEQLQAARYFAGKYSRRVDDVVEVVAHAYFTAQELRVDPLLVLAMISIESAFNPRARSLMGAEGLMQVRTAVHGEKFDAFGGPAAAFDPVANIHVGTTILRDHLLREGSVEAALKAYVGAARRRNDGGYGQRVMRERDALQQALAAQTQVAAQGIDRVESSVLNLF